MIGELVHVCHGNLLAIARELLDLETIYCQRMGVNIVYVLL